MWTVSLLICCVVFYPTSQCLTLAKDKRCSLKILIYVFLNAKNCTECWEIITWNAYNIINSRIYYWGISAKHFHKFFKFSTNTSRKVQLSIFNSIQHSKNLSYLQCTQTCKPWFFPLLKNTNNTKFSENFRWNLIFEEIKCL